LHCWTFSTTPKIYLLTTAQLKMTSSRGPVWEKHRFDTAQQRLTWLKARYNRTDLDDDEANWIEVQLYGFADEGDRDLEDDGEEGQHWVRIIRTPADDHTVFQLPVPPIEEESSEEEEEDERTCSPNTARYELHR
jgi:hypothetical protein